MLDSGGELLGGKSMSSIEYLGGEPWPSRIATRWGHQGARLLIAAIIGSITLRLRPPPAGTALSLMVPVAVMALVITSWLLMRQHDRRLCEACMRTMPLNASEQAARQVSRFRVTHLGSNKLLVVGYLVFLVGSAFVPGRLGLAVWTSAQLSMIYLVLSYSSHRRLQPWCPWCNERGPGEDHDVQAPDPMPNGYQRV
jgi:hypothetical protein